MNRVFDGEAVALCYTATYRVLKVADEVCTLSGKDNTVQRCARPSLISHIYLKATATVFAVFAADRARRKLLIGIESGCFYGCILGTPGRPASGGGATGGHSAYIVV